MDKLERMGFRGICYNLMKTYLMNRKQYTVINNCTSDRRNVSIGVPQGSILGPLLYLLYVHSLKFLRLQCEHFMYADDTALVFSGSKGECENLVNCNLEKYFNWQQ
ncbi:hypothetical protein WA026_021705 [Henosepilachna vigintioctopunctata]|uniref:Reverse transcriptase domain-containing protein n=1 Tax=Henosepilachna vigintioctopunctata TaxID=420089 RepID=A0AAW1U3V8_9CUCU